MAAVLITFMALFVKAKKSMLFAKMKNLNCAWKEHLKIHRAGKAKVFFRTQKPNAFRGSALLIQFISF